MHAGCNSFRISIEWSRLFPEQNKLDHEAVQRYNDIFDCLERCVSFIQFSDRAIACKAALPCCSCMVQYPCKQPIAHPEHQYCLHTGKIVSYLESVHQNVTPCPTVTMLHCKLQVQSHVLMRKYMRLFPKKFCIQHNQHMLTSSKIMLKFIFGLVCRAGMSPNVTLHWFAHPQWFHELGEFQNEENIPIFANWAETAFKLFGMPKCMQTLRSLVWQSQTAYEGFLFLSSYVQCMQPIIA